MDHRQSTGDEDESLVFVLILSTFISVVTLIPVFYAYAEAGEGLRFMGIVKDVTDANTYFDYMNQAAEGHFFFRNSYTAEPMRPLLIRPLFWAMGIVSLVLPPIFTWHLFRVLSIYAFCWTLHWLVSDLTPSRSIRRMSLVVGSLGAGFGYLSLLLGDHLPKTFGAVDLWQGEAIPFLAFHGPPHFTFSIALMMGVVGLFHRAVVDRSTRDAIGAGVACFVLGFVHIYDVASVFAVCGVFLLAVMASERSFDWQRVRIGIVFLAISLPSFVYYVVVFTTDPIYTRWMTQNLLTSPPRLDYLMGFGPVLAFALVGLVAARLRPAPFRARGLLLLGVWLGVGSLLLYFPVSFQRRMAEGLFVPMSILAAWGLSAMGMKMRDRGWSSGALQSGFIVFLLLAIPSNLYTTARLFSPNYDPRAFNSVPFHLTEDEFQALDWLRLNTTPDQVVLATLRTGNFVPRISANKVFAGHWVQTIDYRRKMKWYRRFAAGRVTEGEVRERGIDFMIFAGDNPTDFPVVFEAGRLRVAHVPRSARP